MVRVLRLRVPGRAEAQLSTVAASRVPDITTEPGAGLSGSGGLISQSESRAGRRTGPGRTEHRSNLESAFMVVTAAMKYSFQVHK